MLLNSYLEDIVNNTLGIILTFNKKGEIVELNKRAEEELGYAEGEEVFVWDIFRKIFQEKLDINQFIELHKDLQIETLIYRKNQTCFPAEIRFGKVIVMEELYVCSITNTLTQTELKKELMRAEEEAREALNVRNEFVANVTHELRTPVNGIQGHVKYLMEQQDTTQEQYKTLQIIDKCCDNMSHIINNILDFAKINAGKFELEEKEFSLRECLKYVIETNIKIANEKGISLTLRVAEDIPDEMIGDELRLTQILNNLISNALKFTSIGYVKVEVVQIVHVADEIELFFMVIDSGIGIAKENKDKLFKSFSQVDGSITRKYGGTGLGLSVSKELVEMMRGKVNCESEVGKGSTFSFSIFLRTKEKVLDNGMQMLAETTENLLARTRKAMEALEEVSVVYQYGTEENEKELNSNLEKLIICIEMGSWYRAEEFAKNVKKLVEHAPSKDYSKKAFKLEMAVRREDYDNSKILFEEMKQLLQ